MEGPISPYEQHQRLDGCRLERSEQQVSGGFGISQLACSLITNRL